MPPDCAAPHPTANSPIKVLIVEDEFVIAANLKETLEALGYVVTGMADSLIETLTQVKQDYPDVVLMDIQLRGPQDGIAIAALLWELFQLPVVYLTGHSDRFTLKRANASRPFGYLVKPVQPTDLVMAINVAYRFGRAQQS